MFCDGEKIRLRFFQLCGISQNSGRVLYGGEIAVFPSDPCAVLPGDAVIKEMMRCGGDPAETDDDFRTQQMSFIAEIGHTEILFLLPRIPVAGRVAFYDIGQIDLPAAESCTCEELIQHLSGGVRQREHPLRLHGLPELPRSS